jgi:NAD(P)-dependent dehydrogenase (short-subunit alcohol dehydrogenase family)
MSLYRADPKDGCAWVTGASSGIGRALALALAAEGYEVAATGRDVERLGEVVAESSGLPGRVVAFPCDITDEKAMRDAVGAIEAEFGPLALAVFNAGNYRPTRGENLKVANVVETFQVNLFGVVNGLAPAIERMRGRGRGQVVLVASVTSYFGLPLAAAYGASKAALNNMAESLKHDLDRFNIRVQVVNPGFVDTPLTRMNDYAMPALMPVDKAAARMARGFRTGGFEITFPRRFTWVLKLVRVLPMPVRYWLVHRATGWNRKPRTGA